MKSWRKSAHAELVEAWGGGFQRPPRTINVVIATIALVWTPLVPVAGAQTLTTTTTHYVYNGDGALTAVTRQIDEQAPATTYLTWDDFVPDANDPSTGTVSVNDGRLVGYGPVPGTTNQQATFAFDRRDRLVGYAGDARSIAYDYHATGLMASAAADGASGWRFYYDDGGNAQVTNIYEPGSQRWSAHLGAARFVSDGTEQILVQPRKDLACEYDPATQAVTPHRYDAYGAQATVPLADAYDLGDNPFQYAGEFRDPLWGGIYLRARWYHPDLPVFLSRDAMIQQINHYGYTNGNPVMRTDPSGRRSLRKGLKKLNKGIGGHVLRFFLSPILGPLELAANPRGFWKQFLDVKSGVSFFLAAGIAAELTGPIGDALAPEWINALSINRRFALRLGTDAFIGFGQSATAAGLLHGLKHFNWNTFAQGSEYTLGGIFWARMVAGLGYRPFGLKSDSLHLFLRANWPEEGEALIFRDYAKGGEATGNIRESSASIGRAGVNAGSEWSGTGLNWTSPLQEGLNLGLYHERVVAVTNRGEVFISEFQRGFVTMRGDITSYIQHVSAENRRLELVGRKPGFNRWEFMRLNPRKFLTEFQFAEYKQAMENGEVYDREFRKYNRRTNNCHHHSAAVIRALGVQ
jgi:RHS repeat-associated protein